MGGMDGYARGKTKIECYFNFRREVKSGKSALKKRLAYSWLPEGRISLISLRFNDSAEKRYKRRWLFVSALLVKAFQLGNAGCTSRPLGVL